MAATPPAKRDEMQKYLAQKFASVLKVETAELKKDPAYAREVGEIEKKIKLLEYQMVPEPKIRALWDRGTPSPSIFFVEAIRQASVPKWMRVRLRCSQQRLYHTTSVRLGRFVEDRPAFSLRQWMTNPDHPLTSRVMVNRIWQHHFGTGIVKSLGNFGKTGAPLRIRSCWTGLRQNL